MLLGFIIVIIVLFIFINSDQEKGNSLLFQFNFLSENTIKIILLICFSIVIFIPPVLSSKTIILWEEIPFWNYFRAIFVVFGCTFLPGSSLYRMIFPNDTLAKKFKIESFFLKMIIYPILSFGFLGVSILVFDQLELLKFEIEILLIILIIFLFLMDIILQMKRGNSIELGITNIKISKYSSFILLLAIGISTMSIGFQLGWKYLLSGDPWDAIKFANQIGIKGTSSISIDSYPNFWGYISYGLGTLAGMPFININSLIVPFSYLFITSIYLFMRALLYKFKGSYAVFSTILISIFSGLFIYNPIFSMIMGGEFLFIYKSYSYILLFTGLALLFVSINSKSINKFKIRSFWRLEEFRLFILAAFMLTISFMTYVFPLLIGMIFLFLYSILSEKKIRLTNLRLFVFFALMIIIIFILFDLLLHFYLSYIIIQRFLPFFDFRPLTIIIEAISPPLLIYSSFLILFLFIYSLKLLVHKITRNNENIGTGRKKILKFIQLTAIIFFIMFLFIEILIIILENFILNIDLSENIFFFLYLDNFFLSIGFIGFIGILFSYYIRKLDRNLYLSLLSWVIFSFLLAFLLIIFENIMNFPLEEVSDQRIFILDYWFERIWIYSIPSLCIFASIGLIGILNKLKNKRIILEHKLLFPISKNIISLSLILFSFSGIIFSGILYGNANFRYTNTQIKTLDWISENIPDRTSVLVGDNFFMGVGVESITFVKQYFFYDIFETELNETQCIQKIEFLKNETIQYIVVSQFFISYYLNKSDFTNNILLPEFYNITLYQYGDLSVHYAPYFT